MLFYKLSVLTAVAVLSVFAGKAAEYRISAPNGVGDVVALTNAFTELNKKNTTGSKILLEPGVYDLTGLRVGTRNWHLTLEKQMADGLIAGTGDSPADTVIKGGGETDKYGIFYIWYTHASKPTVISNLTLTCGYSRGNGGAVFGSYGSYGCNLVLSDLIVSNNYAVGSNGGGGGAAVHVKAYNCLFASNTCGEQHGGALVFYDMPNGGAWNCVFSNNTVQTSGKNGGAVYVYNKGVSRDYGGSISNCLFVGNSTPSNGGGFYASTSAENASYSALCQDCVFKVNSASYGGGAYVSSEVVISNCTFEANTASSGGGLRAISSAQCIDGLFMTNVAENGAGLRIGGNAACRSGVFVGNAAEYGSGAYVEDEALVTGSVFRENGKTGATAGVTPYYGGGVYLASGACADCDFIGNFCDNGGGAYMTSRSAVISGSLFEGNRQTGWNSGAAVLVKGSASLALVSNCVFNANIATNWSSRTIVSNAELVDCVVSNHNIYGAVLQNCNLTRCYVADNVSTVGAGVDLDDVKTESIGAHVRTNVNCVFVGNHLTETTVATGDKVVINCTYVQNRFDSLNYGCPVSDCLVWNSLFADNIVSGSKRDMRRFDHQGNIVQRNLTNCVFKTVAADFPLDAEGYSGCKTAPKFTFLPSADGGAYDIRSGCAAFNAGVTEDWMLPLLGGTDFAGRPRVKFGRIDVGALECAVYPHFLMIIR